MYLYILLLSFLWNRFRRVELLITVLSVFKIFIDICQIAFPRAEETPVAQQQHMKEPAPLDGYAAETPWVQLQTVSLNKHCDKTSDVNFLVS